MYIYMCVYICKYVCVNIYMYIYIYIFANMYNIQINICKDVSVYVCMVKRNISVEHSATATGIAVHGPWSCPSVEGQQLLDLSAVEFGQGRESLGQIDYLGVSSNMS